MGRCCEQHKATWQPGHRYRGRPSPLQPWSRLCFLGAHCYNPKPLLQLRPLLMTPGGGIWARISQSIQTTLHFCIPADSLLWQGRGTRVAHCQGSTGREEQISAWPRSLCYLQEDSSVLPPPPCSETSRGLDVHWRQVAKESVGETGTRVPSHSCLPGPEPGGAISAPRGCESRDR